MIRAEHDRQWSSLARKPSVDRVEGYSLVELAMVLVIVALIVAAMTLGGGRVVEGARVSSVINRVKDIGVAAREFRARYGYFPGDLPDASASLTAGGVVSAGCVYPIGGNVANGIVDTAAERACSVEHLVRARLIDKAEIVGGGLVVSTELGAGQIMLGHEADTNNNAIWVTLIPCQAALSIDRKLDAASATPLSFGVVTALNAGGALINDCTPGGANDPVQILRIRY